MKTLSQYILEDVYVGSSDTAIYKRLAQHKWNHLVTDRREPIIKQYPDIENNTNTLIKWFKETNGLLVPDDKEIIHRDDWNMLEQIGEIESSLMSPHKWTYFDYICKNPHKTNKILVVLECSNSKPYCQDSSKKWYFTRFRSFCDFACGAYGIVPEEYSQLYPVRTDEWAHSDESESVAFKYNLISCNRGYKYIKAMGYEKVIVFFQNPDPEEFMKWMKKFPDMEGKLEFVVTDELKKNIKNKYKLKAGLEVCRCLAYPQTKQKFMNILKSCLNGDDLERFEELEKLIKNKEDDKVIEWCEKTNKKFNIQPYRTDKPGFECKLKRNEIPMHTYTSDVTKEKVTEYISWLKEWARKMNKVKISEEIELGKERLLFTPLDLLIDKYNLGPKNPMKLDIDELYWNMMKALEEVGDEIGVERLNKDKYKRYNYLWVFKRVYDFMPKKDLIKYSDKIGYSQFNQNVLER